MQLFSDFSFFALNVTLEQLALFATHGLDAWEKLRSGGTKLMQKYPVQICGYCPEVQVGPKGHRMRDGQHGWQKATIDDLVPPVYVYHIRDRCTNICTPLS
ncbi:hypothetical protein LIER_29172 [Lithospermum erythrorhizon]|uniref:APO domain-containing protein n=1 Tax=Lithospermum erythrorhizon TaxID=34254 RepID=A0AAV3RLT5_LITER